MPIIFFEYSLVYGKVHKKSEEKYKKILFFKSGIKNVQKIKEI